MDESIEEHSEAFLKDIMKCHENFIIKAQSAYIAGLKDPVDGMQWLHNLLWGPGLLPNDDDIELGAQAYCDANIKN